MGKRIKCIEDFNIKGEISKLLYNDGFKIFCLVFFNRLFLLRFNLYIYLI